MHFRRVYMSLFVGRESELNNLQNLYNRKKRALVVGKGLTAAY